MNIHPQLRALRSDDAPQRQAQAALYRAMDLWRSRREFRAIQAGLQRYAEGAALADCAALAALFDAGRPDARDFVSDFNAAAARALADAPLGHMPFRHFTDGTVSTLLLCGARDVSLMLVAVDGVALAAAPAPVSVSLSPAQCHDHVLAGAAEAELVEARVSGPITASLTRRVARLAPGCVLSRDGGREALLYRRVTRSLVSLRLVRRMAAAGPGREYRLADGALVHQSAGHVRDSRLELMATLLGRMQRKDAAPILAEMARERGAEGLRWQALRECLGLDTATGFAALCAMADAPDDPLGPAAAALRTRLVAAHPELERVLPCPA